MCIHLYIWTWSWVDSLNGCQGTDFTRWLLLPFSNWALICEFIQSSEHSYVYIYIYIAMVVAVFSLSMQHLSGKIRWSWLEFVSNLMDWNPGSVRCVKLATLDDWMLIWPDRCTNHGLLSSFSLVMIFSHSQWNIIVIQVPYLWSCACWNERFQDGHVFSAKLGFHTFEDHRYHNHLTIVVASMRQFSENWVVFNGDELKAMISCLRWKNRIFFTTSMPSSRIQTSQEGKLLITVSVGSLILLGGATNVGFTCGGFLRFLGPPNHPF